MEKKKELSRILEKPLFWVVFVALAFGVPLYRSLTKQAPPPLPVLSQLENFTLQNEDGREIQFNRDLRGSVLVVNFVFTSCPHTCPLLTAQMKKIQERVRSARGTVRLVSISVDPQNDTPAVLKKFATEYKADPFVWTFLTGDYRTIEKVVVEGFKVALDRQNEKSSAETLMDITHGEHFVIVDQLGRIRDYSRANNEVEINNIVRKVAILMNSNPLASKAR